MQERGGTVKFEDRSDKKSGKVYINRQKDGKEFL